MNAPRKMRVSAIIVVLAFIVGCSSVFHELQWHRLHMLNRYDKGPSLDPEFNASRSTVPPAFNSQQTSSELANTTQPISGAQVRAQSPNE